MTLTSDSVTRQTAASYRYLWRRHPGRGWYDGTEDHFVRLAEAVGLSAVHGLVLDAGCGNGGDLPHLAAHRGVSVVGLRDVTMVNARGWMVMGRKSQPC